jgi:hypothetical protein
MDVEIRMILPLPGATVTLLERKESCYARLSWGGVTRFLPMTHAEYNTYQSVQREFDDVAATEQRSSERTRPMRDAAAAAKRGGRAMAAVAGAGAGAGVP